MKKTRKTILLGVLCVIAIALPSCDYDQYPYTGINEAFIYSPNSVLALEYATLTFEQPGSVCHAEILYDTLCLPQYVWSYEIQFPCKEQERKKWKTFKSAPDYQYLKVTRISGDEPVYVNCDLDLYVNDSLILFPNQEQTTEKIEKIIGGLRSINRGYYWDDNKQHKISRFANDWALDSQYKKDGKTAITIEE